MNSDFEKLNGYSSRYPGTHKRMLIKIIFFLGGEQL